MGGGLINRAEHPQRTSTVAAISLQIQARQTAGLTRSFADVIACASQESPSTETRRAKRCGSRVDAQEIKVMESQQPSVIVRLLIFSGRPDPEWALDENAGNELFTRVREAFGREKSNPPPPPSLGYRGFLVKPARTDMAEFTVSNGVLTVGSGRQATHWRDVTGVEELLLTQARERGYGEALDLFGAGPKERTQGPATSAS